MSRNLSFFFVFLSHKFIHSLPVGHISRLSTNNRRPTDRPTDQRRTDRIPVRLMGRHRRSARRSATVGDWYVFFLFGPSVRRSAIDGIIFSWMIWTGSPSVGDQWVKCTIGRSVANLVLSSSSYYYSVSWLVADGKKKGSVGKIYDWSVGGQFGPLFFLILLFC